MMPFAAMRLRSGGIAPTDPNYSSVALLLHGDGADGGTTFTDNSPTPKTVTPSSGTTTSNTRVKFGPTSMGFSSSAPSEKLTIPHSADLAPTGDFTVETWLYLSSSSGVGQRIIVWKSVSTGHTPYAMRLTTASKVQCFASNAAGSALAINMTGSTTVTTGSWHHIALTRSGSTYRLFIDGVLDASGTNAEAGYVNAAHSVVIGNSSDDLFPIGGEGTAWMDDFRITNGVGRYTANFTPPTAPFPNS